MDERGGGLDKDPSITQTASETVVSAPGDSSLLNTPDSSLVNPDVIPVVSNRFGRRSLLEGLIGVGLGITAAVVPVPKKHIPSFANETLLGRLLHRFLGTRVVRAEGGERAETQTAVLSEFAVNPDNVGDQTAAPAPGGVENEPDVSTPPEADSSAELRPFNTSYEYRSSHGEVIRIVNPETGMAGVKVFETNGQPDQSKIDAYAQQMRIATSRNLKPGERPIQVQEIICIPNLTERTDLPSYMPEKYAAYCNGQSGRNRVCDPYYFVAREDDKNNGVQRVYIQFNNPRFLPSNKGIEQDIRSIKATFSAIMANQMRDYELNVSSEEERLAMARDQQTDLLHNRLIFDINAFQVFTPYDA